ncbi:hypothetical protein B5F83_04500 [Muribaculum sp. An289]|uniref:methyltransferase RsmF C-terminal domain-like protein n=2 Tax=unclassified Muribaculum TaxID=2622126 RepID=UPI000B3AD89E|nr:hypothetical protein [Muribaculum sp. An287]OUO37492.1 hypothetical protein B5F83_04500 [Muribaculum sp. An289]OUO43411.1 hypothetical protein B5F81_04060 [Muribaculum sp. An287]
MDVPGNSTTGNIPDAFVRYLTDVAGHEKASVAVASLSSLPCTSIRVNPSKFAGADNAGYRYRPVPWSRFGAILENRPVFTLDPYFHAGAYYVQDISSMFIGHAFSAILGDSGLGGCPLKILDLCAAPGGKTTDLASRMPEGSLLVANEVIRQRVGTLRDNVMIWGSPDVAVTCGDPSRFGKHLVDFFDFVIVDAPCSGEGMFRKDPSALGQWSEDTVSLCSARQKRILADVWPALKPGGVLIYSTCTYNRYENGDNIAWMKSSFGAESVPVRCPEAENAGAIPDEHGGMLFIYGVTEGEGQYCAAVRKPEGAFAAYPEKKAGYVPVKGFLEKAFDRKMFSLRNADGEAVEVLPENLCGMLPYIRQAVPVLSAGVIAGSMRGKDFVPDASLALSSAYERDFYPRMPVDRETALRFLAKENIFLSGYPKGYLAVEYGGLPIGFVKNIGARMNNLHPSSRRIRMDIKLRNDE